MARIAVWFVRQWLEVAKKGIFHLKKRGAWLKLRIAKQTNQGGPFVNS